MWKVKQANIYKCMNIGQVQCSILSMLTSQCCISALSALISLGMITITYYMCICTVHVRCDSFIGPYLKDMLCKLY